METVTEDSGYSGKYLPEPTAHVADVMQKVQTDAEYQMWQRNRGQRDAVLTDEAAGCLAAIPRDL